ncbi:hypothetical protein K0H71_06445 [Bacillus sp. IITD106]|nr:hypothetical protein [Bacillus sp. IITD106]
MVNIPFIDALTELEFIAEVLNPEIGALHELEFKVEGPQSRDWCPSRVGIQN